MKKIIFALIFPSLVFAAPGIRFAEYDVDAGTLGASGAAGDFDAEAELITNEGSLGDVRVNRSLWRYVRGPASEDTRWLQVVSPSEGPSEWFPVTRINEWVPDVVMTVDEVRLAGGVVNLEQGLSLEVDTTGLDPLDEVSWRSVTPHSGNGFIPLTGRYLFTHNTDQEVPVTIVSIGHAPSDSIFMIEYLNGLDWVHEGVDGPTLSPDPVSLNAGVARADRTIRPGERKEIQTSKSEIPYFIDRRITYGGRTVELHYPQDLGITQERIALIQNGMLTSKQIFDEDPTCQPHGTPQYIKQIILPDIAANLGYTGRAVGSDRVNLAKNVVWLDHFKLDSLIAHEAAHTQTFHLWKILSWLANKRPGFGEEKLLNLLWTLEAYAVLFEYDKFRFSNDSWMEDNAIGTFFPVWVSPRWGLRSRMQLVDITNGTVEPRYQYQLGLYLAFARDFAQKSDGTIGYNVPTLCQYFGDPVNQQDLLLGNANRVLNRYYKALWAFSQYVSEINLGRGLYQPQITWDLGNVVIVDTDNAVLPTQYEHGAGIGPQLKEGETMVMLFSWHPKKGYVNDIYFHVPLRDPDLWQAAIVVEKDTGRPVELYNHWMLDWWLSRKIFSVPYHSGQLAMTPVSGLRRISSDGPAPLQGDAEFSCFLFGNIDRIQGVELYNPDTYPCEAIGQ